MTPGTRRRFWNVLYVTVLFAGVCGLFATLRGADFCVLDDYRYVWCSLRIRKGLSFQSVVWAFKALGFEGLWTPLTWLSYMTDISLWGLHPGALHLVNVMFHGLNSVWVFILLRRVTHVHGKTSDTEVCTCFLAALLWAVHPLRVEPVAWIASRKDMLFLFWELLALLFWLRRLDRVEGTVNRAFSVYYGLSLVCFVAACLSKPVAMTFPLLAGLLEFLQSKRIRYRDYFAPFVIALTAGAVAQQAQAAAGATVDLAAVSFVGRLLNAVAAFGTYCWQTVYPAGLATPYLHRWPDLPLFLPAGSAICAVFGLLLVLTGARCVTRYALVPFESGVFFKAFNRVAQSVAESRPAQALVSVLGEEGTRTVCVGLAFFTVAVAPTLGFANFGYHAHADRFTYLPAVGFSLIMVMALKKSRLARVAGAAAVLVLSLVTINQLGYWKNDYVWAQRSWALYPERNYLACAHLGLYLFGVEHRSEEALPWFERAKALDYGKSINIHLTHVLALAETGKREKARQECLRFSEWLDQTMTRQNLTAEGTPRFTRSVMTYVQYAILAVYEKDFELAREHVRQVRRYEPDNVFADYLEGLMATWEGDRVKAAGYWKRCLESVDNVGFRFLKKASLAEQ